MAWKNSNQYGLQEETTGGVTKYRIVKSSGNGVPYNISDEIDEAIGIANVISSRVTAVESGLLEETERATAAELSNYNDIVAETTRAIAVEETKADKDSITETKTIRYADLDEATHTKYINPLYADKSDIRLQLIVAGNIGGVYSVDFDSSGELDFTDYGITPDSDFEADIIGAMGDLNSYIAKSDLIDRISSIQLFDIDNRIIGQSIASTGVYSDPAVTTSTTTGIIPVETGQTIRLSNFPVNQAGSKRAAWIKQDGSRIAAVAQGAANNTVLSTTPIFIVPTSTSPIVGFEATLFNTAAPFNETIAVIADFSIANGNSAATYTPYETAIDKIGSKSIAASYFKDDNGLLKKLRPHSSYMELAYIGDEIHVRTTYNDTQDFVHKAQMINANGIFNFIQGRYIQKTDDILATGVEINTGGDNVAPMQYISFGNISGNHGFEAAQSVGSAHGKTSSDVSAIYAFGSDEFYLTEVPNSTTLVFFGRPKVVGSEMGVSIIPPSGSVLTWVSGGVSTSPITLGTLSTVQKYPTTKIVEQQLIVSGQYITDQGYYYSDDIKVVNRYAVGDPSTMINENPFLYNTSGILSYFDIVYDFNPSGIITMTPSWTNEQNRAIVNFGIIQDQELPLNGYPSRYVYAPRIAVSDYDTLKDTTIRPVEITRLTNADMVDADKPEHMHIQFAGNSRTDLRIGHAVGYNFLHGIGKDSERVNNSEVLYINTNNKLYLRLFAGTSTVGRMSLQRVMWATAYYGYFDPQVNPALTACFDYKFGNKRLLYIHAHQTLTKAKVRVPQYLNGMKIESIADSNGNMTLITDDYIPSGGLYINNIDHGYLILLLS